MKSSLKKMFKRKLKKKLKKRLKINKKKPNLNNMKRKDLEDAIGKI